MVGYTLHQIGHNPLIEYEPDPREAEEGAEEGDIVETPVFDLHDFLWLPCLLPVTPDRDPELSIYGVNPDKAIDPQHMFNSES